MYYSVSGLKMREIKAVTTISREASEELIAQGRPISQDTWDGVGSAGKEEGEREAGCLVGGQQVVSLCSCLSRSLYLSFWVLGRTLRL